MSKIVSSITGQGANDCNGCRKALDLHDFCALPFVHIRLTETWEELQYCRTDLYSRDQLSRRIDPDKQSVTLTFDNRSSNNLGKHLRSAVSLIFVTNDRISWELSKQKTIKTNLNQKLFQAIKKKKKKKKKKEIITSSIVYPLPRKTIMPA